MRLSPFSLLSLQIVCVVAMFCSVALTDDARSGNPSVSSFAGTKVGQVLDDNCLTTPLVWIPPGKFTMGSPKGKNGGAAVENEVQVTITKGFWLGKYEVTQLEWQTVMQTTPWNGKDNVKEMDDYPATYVSWDDAMKFCEKLTATERQAGQLPAGWKYTLPTEAQWEYACRAGTTTRFSFGDKDGELGEYAWFIQNAMNEGKEYAHSLGQKKPNPWGLYDMHGNVWEWCRDRYAKTLPGGTDAEVSAGGSNRVLRGGCWNNTAWRCRSANRNSRTPGTRDDDLGFRLSAVPSGK
jgi:formylglycine-generating enzyme required for sulfatase activity